jgi:toxin ParE1/3/4
LFGGLKKALLSLENITHHIADDNPEAATRTAQNIYEHIEELVTFPNRGRIGRREGTRELVLAPLPYIVVYRLKDSTIEILQIRHGARNAN